MLTVIWGTPLLRILQHFKIGKTIRVEGPERHFSKMGTPTMGGVMIVLPVVLLTSLLNAGSLMGLTVLGRSVLLPMTVMLATHSWERWMIGKASAGRVRDWGCRPHQFLIRWLWRWRPLLGFAMSSARRNCSCLL
jgi:hypothetical protein